MHFHHERSWTESAAVFVGLLVRRCAPLVLATLLTATSVRPASATQRRSADTAIAIVNTTLIDGNGGAPAPNMTIVIAKGRIAAVGPAARVAIPKNARTIDGSRLWVIPGLINTNIFFTYVSCPGVDSTNRFLSAVGCAQLHLRNGETTVMDSHGFLDVQTRLRDMINRGEILGPRLVVAGNILGYGPGCSSTGSLWPLGDMCDDSVATSTVNPTLRATIDSLLGPTGHGTGGELAALSPESLRVRVDAYLDRGPDFIKYLATPHASPGSPRDETHPVFSQRQQEVIIETAHRRGKFVSTHCSTLDHMRGCALAGVDMFQHASAINDAIPDDFATLLGKKPTICSISFPWAYPDNFVKLWKSGCTVSLETDDNSLLIPVIESAAASGMTPLEAITAATKNGAIAAHLSNEIGTIEPGKVADLVLLRADPTVDISNIREIELVIARGQIVPKTSGAEDGDPTQTPEP